MERVQPPASPIIVKIIEPPVRGFGLGDVIINAVGLTGVMVIGAVVLGCVLAAVIIGYRKFQVRRLTDDEAAQTQSLGLTPPARR
jgi:membrane protein CcdC involved in cytochrome C biogenesis